MATTGIWDPVQRLSLESRNTTVSNNTKITHSETLMLTSPDTTSLSSVTNCNSIGNNFTQLKIHDIGRLIVNSKLCDNINQNTNCKQIIAFHTEAQKLNLNHNLNNRENFSKQFPVKEQQNQQIGQDKHKSVSHFDHFENEKSEHGFQTNSFSPSLINQSPNKINSFKICSQLIKKSPQSQPLVQPMFEGKNIHFSAADNKPLCSYSGKLCKQRRVNGYAFCIRHILEDKSAPFKQCSHVAKYNNNKCTNPIPANEDRSYCNSHMQTSGMAPKKDRKEKSQLLIPNSLNRSLSCSSSANSIGIKSSSVNNNHGTVSISVSSSPSSPLSNNTIKSNLATSFGTIKSSGNNKSYNITIPPSLHPSPTFQSLSSNSTEHISSIVPELFNEKLKLIGREMDLIKMNNNNNNKLPINGKNNLTSINSSSLGENKKIDNTITISITSSTSPATSSHSQTSNVLNLNLSKEGTFFKENKKKMENVGRKTCNLKRKKSSSIQKSLSSKNFIYARKKLGHSSRDDLFHYQLYSSSSEDEAFLSSEDENICIKPFPSITMSSFLSHSDFEVSELRNQLLLQKWLLNNLIKVREYQLKALTSRTKRVLNSNLEKQGKTYLDHLLEKKKTRVDSHSFKSPLSIRKGICCYTNENLKCSQPSLPFTRHCRNHILYNVDQLLFTRCTAKDSKTSTQCCNSSLDVVKDEPLCNYHWQLKARSKVDSCFKNEESETFTADLAVSFSGKGKGKTKWQATARPGRKSKKRKKVEEKDGNGSLDIVDNTSLLSQDSSEASLLNSSEKCDAPKNNISLVKLSSTNTTPSSSGQLQSIPVSSAISSPVSLSQPSLVSERALFNNISIISPSSSSSNNLPHSISSSSVDIESVPSESVRLPIPTSFDVDVVHNFAPSDEALVASLVADLPPLCTETGPDPEPTTFVDADLTDVLNKIPDDAFNDLLLDNFKNGDTPSKEESEALEQALAMANKNVHYLSVAAAVVSSRTNQNTSSSSDTINGDNNYYSHLLNGQVTSDVQNRQGTPASYNLNENDILGLANNIFGSLTTEQQQQLNGLIDGALASVSLTSSPTLKSSLLQLNNTITPEQEQSDICSL